MLRKPFTVAFRSLARRFDVCLAEVNKHLDDLYNLDINVEYEVDTLHAQFMKLTLDDVDMEKDVYAKLSEPDGEDFTSRWNRVVDFVLTYEEILGADPVFKAEYETWQKKHSAAVAMA